MRKNLFEGALAKGGEQEALRALERAIRDKPTDIASLSMKGALLELMAESGKYGSRSKEGRRNWELARRCYERILELRPEDVNATADLGDYWFVRGYPAMAYICYDRALLLAERGAPGTATFAGDFSTNRLQRVLTEWGRRKLAASWGRRLNRVRAASRRSVGRGRLRGRGGHARRS